MSNYKNFIDNKRVVLRDELLKIAPNHDVLRIATGYWDLQGTFELIDELKKYKKIKLMIGKEPLASRYQENLQLDLKAPENLFPNEDIKFDLNNIHSDEINDLRNTAKELVELIEKGILEVKVFREPILHAKAYIFGEYDSENAVGVIGSSNFTRAGLTKNAELNFLTNDHMIVTYEPKSTSQNHGHISWFEELWNSEGAVEWNGEFTSILSNSQVGELTYGPYDVYIKTLMEVFPEELVELENFDEEILEYLHPFQNQNAQALRRKLYTNGLAMLSDSVGLGKTVTAASIIDQYIKEGKKNICLLLPASLKHQWIEELEGTPWFLTYKRDFKIVSQQNLKAIKELTESTLNDATNRNKIDLFVIDEAHNYRNPNSLRYEETLKLLQAHPNAHILLLTATPINNSLLDFAYVIQLAAKGDLTTRKVRYKASENEKLQRIDFLEALKQIQSAASKAERRGEKFDWSKHKSTLINGLRHYLVRSTRQGVIKREAMKNTKKSNNSFPKSIVKRFDYKYSDNDREFIRKQIEKLEFDVFEGINPNKLNINLITDITQRTMHPLDIIHKIKQENDKKSINLFFNVSEEYLNEDIIDDKYFTDAIIQSIFKILNTIGFIPYKLDTYSKDYYGKSIEKIRQNLDKSPFHQRARMQLSIHNMLQVTWLKRLESSTATLLESVKKYSNRLSDFEYWLDKGFLISSVDIDTLTNDYAEDTERAFEDFEKYMDSINVAGVDKEQKKGIIQRIASEDEYELQKLREDLERDKRITDLLIELLSYLSQPKHDAKINTFAKKMFETINENKYGKKVIVFSFFSDTIEYLKTNLPNIIDESVKGFKKKSGFVTGGTKNSTEIAQRFSPKSQNYKFKENEQELDFLFATDVLSEGQNLQDAAILINYDLHWNPVRMIQRNGRINRLGSKYEKILVANATPHDDLEEYLRLLKRLENKIETINNSIGTDQSILGEQANPIEFLENPEEIPNIYSMDVEKASEAMDTLDSEDSLIDWVDDYSLELRHFIDSNSKKEIERIRTIPKGKWNYLPESTNRYSSHDEIIGLFVAKGVETTTNNIVSDSIFVKIRKRSDFGPFSAIQSEYIPEDIALSLIKTTPDDNRRTLDRIEIDRKEYLEKSRTEVLTQIASSKAYRYPLQKSDERALNNLSKYFPNIQHLAIIQKNIAKSNEISEFKKIVRKVNSEVNHLEEISTATLSEYRRFIARLVEKENQQTKYDTAEGILFYAKPR